MYHYVYRISNTKENKHYYGTRTSKVHPKEDLGIKYYSSSTNKEFIKSQKENPQNFKYKIVNIFESREKAISLEIKLHHKFDVGINESFYNKAKQNSLIYDVTGTHWKLNELQKKKRRGDNNVSKRPEVKEKISISKRGDNNPNKNGDCVRGTKHYNDGIKSYMLRPDDKRIVELNLAEGMVNNTKNKMSDRQKGVCINYDLNTNTIRKINIKEKHNLCFSIGSKFRCIHCGEILIVNKSIIEHMNNHKVNNC